MRRKESNQTNKVCDKYLNRNNYPHLAQILFIKVDNRVENDATFAPLGQQLACAQQPLICHRKGIICII